MCLTCIRFLKRLLFAKVDIDYIYFIINIKKKDAPNRTYQIVF